MSSKTCSKCKEFLSPEMFGPNRRRSDGLQTFCKPCQNDYHRDRLAKSPEKRDRRYAAARSRRAKIKEKAIQLKDGPCVDCGFKYPHWQMQWDHIGTDKVANVSSLVGGGASWSRIAAEIAKCELVCGHCHMTRTHLRLNSGKC